MQILNSWWVICQWLWHLFSEPSTWWYTLQELSVSGGANSKIWSISLTLILNMMLYLIDKLFVDEVLSFGQKEYMADTLKNILTIRMNCIFSMSTSLFNWQSICFSGEVGGRHECYQCILSLVPKISQAKENCSNLSRFHGICWRWFS